MSAEPTTAAIQRGKRRLARVLLIYLGGMFVWGVFEPGALEVAKFIALYVFLFTVAAYGLDAILHKLDGSLFKGITK